MRFNPEYEVANPGGMVPCRFCGHYCQGTDAVEDGFDDLGVLIRITSTCKQSDPFDDKNNLTKDDSRTEFLKEPDAVRQWNKMNDLRKGG